MSGFDGLFDFGMPKSEPPAKEAPAERGVQLHGKVIDDTFYIRAEDVVALLEANKLLPKICARLKERI